MVGQTLGKYRIEEKLGRGGMGTVYRAIDETLHRDVAIKVLNSDLNDPEVAKRFRGEAITVARLSHPGIATVYELLDHGGQWYMVMEFVRGETVEALVERSGALPVERAVDICMQALAALTHAHRMGVVHRDLKPANLMITEAGSVKIMDFGIARVTGTEHLTAVGFMMGTPAYMAPEQVMGNEIDARADVYAMGVVLYRLMTGRLPFKGETPFAMAHSQVHDPPTPIGMLRDGLPPWVDHVIHRTLEKAPIDRFQTAAEFREALQCGLSGQPIPPATTGTRTAAIPAELMKTPAPASAPAGSTAGHVRADAPTSGSSAARPLMSAPTDVTSLAATSTGASQVAVPTPESTAATAMAPTPASTAATAMAPTPASTAATAMAPTAASTAATVLAAAPATPGVAAPAAPARVAAKTSSSSSAMRTYAIIGAAVVLIGAIGGFAWWRIRAHRAATAAQAAATIAAAPVGATDLALAPATAVPPASAAGPTGAIPPPSVTPVTALPPSVPAASPLPKPAPSSPPKPPPAPTTAPTTTPSSTPAKNSVGPAAGPNSAAPGAGSKAVPPAPIDDSLVAFGDVKILITKGKNVDDPDAILNFVAGQISVMPRKGGAALASLPYPQVAHAAYIHAKDPVWEAGLAAPTEKLNYPGILRGAHHWLTLQSLTSFIILRLDDATWSHVLSTVEARTGIKVDRRVPGK